MKVCAICVTFVPFISIKKSLISICVQFFSLVLIVGPNFYDIILVGIQKTGERS